MNAKQIWAIPVAVLWLFMSTGCKERPNTKVSPNKGEKILYNSFDAKDPDKRPDWSLIQYAEQGGSFYATGVSDRFTTELDAREHALLKARQEIADYVLNFVETERKESRIRTGSAGEGSDVLVESRNSIASNAHVAVSQVRPKEWFLQKIQAENGKVYWNASVLAEVPRDVIQKEIARVARALNTLEKEEKTFPLKTTTAAPTDDDHAE